MKGEKGSLINRIKDWFRIKKQKKLKQAKEMDQLKRKKKKKLKEKEKQRIIEMTNVKRYGRFQILGRISIGLFLGFFETVIAPKKEEVTAITDEQLKKDHDDLIKFEQSVKRLETALKENSISFEEAINKLEEQKEKYQIYEERYSNAIPSIEPFESKEKQKASLIAEHQNFLDRISTINYRIENNLEKIKLENPIQKKDIIDRQSTNDYQSVEEKETVTDLTVNPVKDILKGIALAPIVLVSKKVQSKEDREELKRKERKDALVETRESYLKTDKVNKISQEENIVEIIKTKVAVDETRRKEIETYLKEFKRNFDDIKHDWKEYEEWVQKTTREKDSERKAYAVEILRNRVKELEKEYNDLSKKGFFLDFEHDFELSKLDPNHLLESSAAIDEFLEKCEKEIQLLKQEPKIVKVEELEEKKEQEKPKKEIQKEEPVEKTNYQDRQLLELSIEKNIQEQEEEINKIKDLFRKAERVKKRKTFLGGFTKFLKNTIHLGLTALPIKLLKNPTIGILGSTIILNNRLRGMRKLINKQNDSLGYINYKEIERQIADQRSLNITTQAILEDTASQLKHLKIEFFWEFSYDLEQHPEIQQIKQQFIAIEAQIAEKNRQLQEMYVELNEMNEKTQQEKSKQKVLQFEEKIEDRTA